MKRGPLGQDENRAFNFSKRFTLAVAGAMINQAFSDFTQSGAGTAQSFTLFTAPKGTLIRSAALWVPTLFAAAGDSGFDDVQVIVGDAGDDDRYLATTQIAANAGSPVQGKAHPSTVPFICTSATAIIAKFTPKTGKALSALTAGRIDIFIDAVNIADLTA